ncbi:hypothetical protein Hanom_Chr14g01252681 [Helianthus anomalus]
MTKLPLGKRTKQGGFNLWNVVRFCFWTKMATKTKPQGLRCKRFQIWTYVAKLPKTQGPKWQFTLSVTFLR